MARIFVIKHKGLPMHQTVETSRIVGKKVMSRDGNKVGKIEAIHIHPRRLTIEGIKVDTGIFGMDEYIGKNYIDSLTSQGAVLRIVPIKNFVGLPVHDSTGKKVGKVKKIERSRKTNNIVSMVVRQGLLKKDLTFQRKHIKDVGKSVMLKVSVKNN